MVTGLRIDPASSKDFQCTACIAAKQSMRPFPKEAETRSMAPGEVTFSDVWGPARKPALGGASYYISFTD
ncbi:hypothetical protein CALCODRAFT_444357, partial [Calocera cornea HHB12733]